MGYGTRETSARIRGRGAGRVLGSGGLFQHLGRRGQSMVSTGHHNNDVADFDRLVKLLPADAVASPLRSTVPLVDFWRTPERRGAGLSDFPHGTPVASHHRIDSQQNHALNRCLRDKNPVEGVPVKGRQALDGEGMFAGDR